MVEIKAVELLREELERSDNCSANPAHLSIRVKWGQNDLVQMGPLRAFLEKYPEVFTFDGQLVKLVNSRAPVLSKAGSVLSKAGPPGLNKPPGLVPPPPAPAKRGWDGTPESPESKARRTEGGEDSYLDDFLNVASKAPSKAASKYAGAANMKAAPEQGCGKGTGKVIKGSFDAKGGSFDGKGAVFNGGEGGKGGDKGKGGDLPPQERKQALQEDRLLPPQAQRGIEAFKTNGVEIELSMLAKKILPVDEARRSAQRCLALVRSSVTSKWGQPSGPNVPSVELCGSYAQGTEVYGSAMDLAFRLPSSFSFDEKANCVSELRSRLGQQTNFLDVCDTLEHYAHTTAPLAVDLKGASPGLVAHILLEEQRVERPPTIDETIKRLCDTFEASYDLVRLVKVWSVNHGLTNLQEGFINGVAWTLLTIFFLQKQKLIPPYSIIAEGQTITPVVSPMPLSSLLQGFFEFLGRSVGLRGISLWHGEEFQGPPSLFLEDPAYFFETKQQRSLSEALGEAQWTRILDEAKKGFTRINVRPGRWFHWAEIFDPTDRKPEKIHGLGAHLASSDSGGAPPSNDAKGFAKGSQQAGLDVKGMGKDGSQLSGKDAAGKGSGKESDGKGWSGKDSDGKGASSWSGKDSGCKGAKDLDGKGESWSGKDSGGKGWSGKDSDGKGSSWSGKDSDGKGSSWSGKDSGSKGGKDDGKGWSGKDSDTKGYGKGKAKW